MLLLVFIPFFYNWSLFFFIQYFKTEQSTKERVSLGFSWKIQLTNEWFCNAQVLGRASPEGILSGTYTGCAVVKGTFKKLLGL